MNTVCECLNLMALTDSAMSGESILHKQFMMGHSSRFISSCLVPGTDSAAGGVSACWSSVMAGSARKAAADAADAENLGPAESDAAAAASILRVVPTPTSRAASNAGNRRALAAASSRIRTVPLPIFGMLSRRAWPVKRRTGVLYVQTEVVRERATRLASSRVEQRWRWKLAVTYGAAAGPPY